MRNLQKAASFMCGIGEAVAVIGILIMVIVSVVDVLGAKLFNVPVPGFTEVISLLQVSVIAFAISTTQLHRGHISVQMFVMKAPPKVASAIGILVSLLSMLLFGAAIWESFNLGASYFKVMEVTATARIPFFPFAYAFGVALMPMPILLLIDIIRGLKEMRT